MEHAMLGWRIMLRDLRDQKPTPHEALQLVAEAELWLLRRRLIRDGRLRMMRWQAISRVPNRLTISSPGDQLVWRSGWRARHERFEHRVKDLMHRSSNP
jgi:hypothetical protein